MLPADQIEAIIGAAPGTGVPNNASGAGTVSCDYADAHLILTATSPEAFDSSVAAVEGDAASSEVITGVGDKVKIITFGDGSAALLAADGNALVVVQGRGSEEEFSALATALLGALG